MLWSFNMIDHDDVYCDIYLNRNEFTDCQLKYIHISSKLDQPFELKVTLTSSEAISFFKKYLYQPFALKISSHNYPARYFNGVLTELHLINKNIYGQYVYEFKVKPAIALYQAQTYQHLFNGISVTDIARQILQGRQFNIAPDLFQEYALKLLGDRHYPPLYRVLMRDETILGFFQRLLNYQGLSYFFDHTTERSLLIISDAIQHFAAEIEARYSPHSPHGLTLNPYIDMITFSNSAVSNNILSTGAPRLEPHTLLTKTMTSNEHSVATLYHLNTHEQMDSAVQARAEIAALAFQSNEKTATLMGGGLLFAGMKVTLNNDEYSQNSWLIRESTIEISFDEQDPTRLGSIATQVFAQDASIRYQAMPQFGEHATLMAGVNLGTPGTEKGANLISVNEQGHYHATLPDNFSSNTEASGVQVFDARMLHPMHSNDHSSHMTLPTDSEGVMLWSEGFSGEPLMLGTLNNSDNIHPTTEANPQNAYWQDNDTNKLGFVNEGIFKPYEKTGRNTASIMETPSYDPEGNKSYVRMGDAIANDAQYPAQAAEPGLFLHTSGNYQEEHQGGLLRIAGNLNQDDQEDGFTPILRHMVQLAPTLGTYNILDSVTAHGMSESLTSDNVSQSHTQDATTITKSLNAENNYQTYNADTTDNIYVNQQHQTQGDYTTATYNNHNLNSQSTTTTILENGDQTTESHDTHTLNLNHTDNQFTTQTQQTTIDSQTTQVNQLTQNFTNYTGQANTLSINSQTSNINANNVSIGGNHFTQGGMLSVMNGSNSPKPPNMFKINGAAMEIIQEEQAQKKKEIVILLDCPHNPPQLALCVNNINPQTIPAGTPFTYPLSNDQKKGEITLSSSINGQATLNTVHKQIRDINIQYKSPVQQPNPWFSPSGKLTGYIGGRTLNIQGLDFSDNDHNVVMMLAKNPPPAQCLKGGGFSASGVNDEVISWIMTQLKTANKTYPYHANTSSNADTVNSDTSWKWHAPTASDYIGLAEDGVSTFAFKHNREFVLEFFTKGQFYVKEVRGEWMLIFKGRAGTRKWIQGTKYSLDSQKVRIFKTYAMMKADKKGIVKGLDLAKDASADTPLNFLLVAPIDVVQYFFFDDDPHKQISDLLVNIGIDTVNAAIAGTLGVLIAVFLSGIITTAGAIVIVGILAAAITGWVIDNVEDNLGIKDKFIEMGRVMQDHFISQDDHLKINFQSFTAAAAQILTGA